MSNFYVERWNKVSQPNSAELRSALENEGFSVFDWSDPPRAIYEAHKHSKDQSHWIISGALELSVEGAGTYVLRAGDRDFLPAETSHSARVVGDEPVIYLIGEKTVK